MCDAAAHGTSYHSSLRTSPPAMNVPDRSFAFSHLVTCVDGEAEGRQALDTSRTLAKRASLPLEIVTVNSPGASEMRDRDELRAMAARTGTHADTVVLHGNEVAQTVATHLATFPSPLLCMASHARNALAEALLGSVSEELLRSTHHPILMVGPRARAITSLSHTLVVCLDGSAASEHILPVAHAWASTFGGDVLAMRYLCDDDGDDRHVRLAGAQLDHAVGWLRERSIAAVSEIASGNSAQDAIAETARRFGVSAVAMTTRARPPLRRFELGSVALHVLREASRSVLIVNPGAS